MNRWGFQESICLCCVILVTNMSARVSVKFTSHLFLVQCLIKESNRVIFLRISWRCSVNPRQLRRNTCSRSLNEEMAAWSDANRKRRRRPPDQCIWRRSGSYNNGGVHLLMFDTVTPAGFIVEGFVVFVVRGGGGTVLLRPIVVSGQWAAPWLSCHAGEASTSQDVKMFPQGFLTCEGWAKVHFDD